MQSIKEFRARNADPHLSRRRAIVIILMMALIGAGAGLFFGRADANGPTRHQIVVHQQHGISSTRSRVVITQRDGSSAARVVGGMNPSARTWSGFYGSSKASGCRTAGIAQEGTTFLGFHAFWYVTGTHWCWVRSRHTISHVYNTWDFSTNSPFKWRGEPTKPKATYYPWIRTAARSGYYHWRKGSFENCWYFCGGEWYPTNAIRVHSNGTYWVKGSGL